MYRAAVVSLLALCPLVACDKDGLPPCSDAEVGAWRAALKALGESRPYFHFSPSRGWMNDPAGLVYAGGEWHLFFQHNPDSTLFGTMRWGHAVSPDLVRWTELDSALLPDPTLGQVYTGSAALRDDGVLVALFTHAFGADGKQKQSLATSSDGGRTFTLAKESPVIPNPGLAAFRDPRLVREGGAWLATVGTDNAAWVYRSTDLVNWSKRAEITFATAPRGTWECPELFPFGEKWLLKADVLPAPLATTESRYWIGSFDGERFTPETEEGRHFDGPDFYAAQIWNDAPDGRRVWIGWASSWAYALVTPAEETRGFMSVPRELSISGGRLVQTPAPEVTAYAKRCSLATQANTKLDERPLAAGSLPAALLLELELEPGTSTDSGLVFAAKRGQRTRIGLRGETLYLDRSRSGEVDFEPTFAREIGRAVQLSNGRLALTILVDRSSFEVFAGGVTLTAQVFPGDSSYTLSGYGGALVHGLRVRPMPPAR
ncbi:MAG: glycoside hydrolase family 32 protein [Deltaproteobacteria bacterium]|nr:glycoside hydrolase family 32 protein [Deltaproteobacteria bacterium]